MYMLKLNLHAYTCIGLHDDIEGATDDTVQTKQPTHRQLVHLKEGSYLSKFYVC